MSPSVFDHPKPDLTAAEAAALLQRMRDAGVLLSTDGPFDNVLKIKPPIVFGEGEADLLAEELERVLVTAPRTPARAARTASSPPAARAPRGPGGHAADRTSRR